MIPFEEYILDMMLRMMEFVRLLVSFDGEIFRFQLELKRSMPFRVVISNEENSLDL